MKKKKKTKKIPILTPVNMCLFVCVYILFLFFFAVVFFSFSPLFFLKFFLPSMTINIMAKCYGLDSPAPLVMLLPQSCC